MLRIIDVKMSMKIPEIERERERERGWNINSSSGGIYDAKNLKKRGFPNEIIKSYGSNR